MHVYYLLKIKANLHANEKDVLFIFSQKYIRAEYFILQSIFSVFQMRSILWFYSCQCWGCCLV